MRVRAMPRLGRAFRMNAASIFSAASTSKIMPSFMGRMVRTPCGARPSSCLASSPTASTSWVRVFTATMEGS